MEASRRRKGTHRQGVADRYENSYNDARDEIFNSLPVAQVGHWELSIGGVDPVWAEGVQVPGGVESYSNETSLSYGEGIHRGRDVPI
jgi:hypothetical protein